MSLAGRALIVDVVLVLVFVAIGRRTHAESGALVGIAATAWPFLVGLAAGWLLGRVHQRPVRVWPEGAAVWLSTVAVGVLLRGLTDAGTAVSFIVVATVVLGVFLLGWRAAAGALGRRSRGRRSRV